MNFASIVFMAALAAAALSVPALAQGADFQLPDQCTTTTGMGDMDHSSMGHGTMHGDQDDDMGAAMMDMMGMDMDLEAMPEHVQENMAKMMVTMPAMHEGMMNEDADVAFACGMIAHHQGAIDMAQVLLDHGDDPQMRALAEEIIEAQVAEIEQMTTWLVANAN
ncbi:CopM family metallochaperone [Pelagibacterium montanilacus]|uniref:CopM family metallochaperone n=1 Tax=Pelagibacterium montanilacus TaxID=2185280 RepID=UPI000F8DBE12|nr:DUF305 domain-containing protein [Pelagibacterium montanilacus]